MDSTYAGEKIINGFKWPPITSDDAPEKVRNFEVRDDDVFVVTYPKSGTHWTVQIMKNILSDGDAEVIEKYYNFNMPMEYLDAYKMYESLPTDRPRLISTHVPLDVLPKQILEGKGKVVYVMRNPKDTAVSFWHFARERHFVEEHQNWDSFLQAYLKPDMMCGNWFDFNLSYYGHRNSKSFFFLTYEEMKLNHERSVIQLSNFISRPLTQHQVDQVVKNTTFNHMKKIFTGKLPNKVLQMKKNNAIGSPDQKFTVMRKGSVGDWKNHFTISENELFDSIYNDKMKGSFLQKRMIFTIDSC